MGAAERCRSGLQVLEDDANPQRAAAFARDFMRYEFAPELIELGLVLFGPPNESGHAAAFLKGFDEGGFDGGGRLVGRALGATLASVGRCSHAFFAGGHTLERLADRAEHAELGSDVVLGLSRQLPAALRISRQPIVRGFRGQGTAGVVLVPNEMDQGTSRRKQVGLAQGPGNARRIFRCGDAGVFSRFDGTSAR